MGVEPYREIGLWYEGYRRSLLSSTELGVSVSSSKWLLETGNGNIVTYRQAVYLKPGWSVYEVGGVLYVHPHSSEYDARRLPSNWVLV